MKFLADANVEKSIIDEIIALKFDIKTVVSINPTMTDIEVLQIANLEKRILITNDKDFGEMVFRQKLLSFGVILIRINNCHTQDKIRRVKKLLIFYRNKISNNFVVISKNKFRATPVK